MVSCKDTLETRLKTVSDIAAVSYVSAVSCRNTLEAYLRRLYDIAANRYYLRYVEMEASRKSHLDPKVNGLGSGG